MENPELSPALQLVHNADEQSSQSFLGGLPKLPPDFEWPSWDATPLYLDEIQFAEKQSKKMSVEQWRSSPWSARISDYRKRLQNPKIPLEFLAQIFLEELPRYTELFDLPTSGSLCFFVDGYNCPPGWRASSKGGYQVIYLEDTANLKIATPPSGLENILNYLYGAVKYESHHISFSPRWTHTRFEQPGIESNADFEINSASNLNRFPDKIESNIILPDQPPEKNPMHILLGYPYIIQNVMEEMCQLCFHGFDEAYRDIYSDPAVSHLKEGVQDWQLLLQLDCDRKLGWEWGDSGMIYFWIRKQDLANRDFSNIWGEMQCC